MREKACVNMIAGWWLAWLAVCVVCCVHGKGPVGQSVVHTEIHVKGR
jgi:hypothetical protein